MKMKKSALTLAVFLTLAALAFGAIQISVSGIGVGFASDQATADQSADQQHAESEDTDAEGFADLKHYATWPSNSAGNMYDTFLTSSTTLPRNSFTAWFSRRRSASIAGTMHPSLPFGPEP